MIMRKMSIFQPHLTNCLRSKVVKRSFFTSEVASALQQATYSLANYSNDDECTNIDWESLGFGLMPTDFMFTMKTCEDMSFKEGQLSRYGNIELSPSAGVLNYAQGLFEGMKAYRREGGQLVLFRPDQNAERMQMGADRMCMPSPSVQQFIEAVKQTALSNKRWIPPPGKGALYLRPLLLGTGPILGLAPAPEYTFIVYASPVRNYFKEGSAALNLLVEDEYDRASPGGAGNVKTIGNYGPALKPMMSARGKGFSDVMYLDSVNRKYVEEVSSCNVFTLKNGLISTPATNGTILPGVTRKSVIEIARDLGYKVEERLIVVEELMEADEVFCTGTAVVIAPVGSITYKGKRVEYETGEKSVAMEVLSTLVGIQNGVIEDKKGWIVEI